MEIQIFRLDKPVTRNELVLFLGHPFDTMVKCVADIKLGKVAVGGEMHSDAELVLLVDNSRQADLWGFNIYPDNDPDTILEYTSLINIRPSANNLSLEIQSEKNRNTVKQLCYSIFTNL